MEKLKNKLLLEYFRELVGTISVKELVHNQALAKRAEKIIHHFQTMSDLEVLP